MLLGPVLAVISPSPLSLELVFLVFLAVSLFRMHLAFSLVRRTKQQNASRWYRYRRGRSKAGGYSGISSILGG